MSTAWFMLGITALLVGIDIWLAATGRETYSEVIRRLGTKYPVFALTLAFVLGALVGHWFL